jgi:hypothetical protein
MVCNPRLVHTRAHPKPKPEKLPSQPVWPVSVVICSNECFSGSTVSEKRFGLVNVGHRGVYGEYSGRREQKSLERSHPTNHRIYFPASLLDVSEQAS